MRRAPRRKFTKTSRLARNSRALRAAREIHENAASLRRRHKRTKKLPREAGAIFLSSRVLCARLYSSKMETISPSRMRFVFFTAQKLPHMLQVSSFSGFDSAR